MPGYQFCFETFFWRLRFCPSCAFASTMKLTVTVVPAIPGRVKPRSVAEPFGKATFIMPMQVGTGAPSGTGNNRPPDERGVVVSGRHVARCENEVDHAPGHDRDGGDRADHLACRRIRGRPYH